MEKFWAVYSSSGQTKKFASKDEALDTAKKRAENAQDSNGPFFILEAVGVFGRVVAPIEYVDLSEK